MFPGLHDALNLEEPALVFKQDEIGLGLNHCMVPYPDESYFLIECTKDINKELEIKRLPEVYVMFVFLRKKTHDYFEPQPRLLHYELSDHLIDFLII